MGSSYLMVGGYVMALPLRLKISQEEGGRAAHPHLYASGNFVGT